MCILPSAVAPVAPTPAAPPCPAQLLGPHQRQQLALQALAGARPVTQLAEDYQVSRTFVYQQAHQAEHALADAFTPDPPDDAVLFYLPVTAVWLKRLILALLLVCHSSYRGVYELLRDLFHCPRSLGYLHGVARAAMGRARALNQRHDLSGVRIGAHDEIFQTNQPVLVGVDVASTYCYLLSLEEQRDAVTWGVRLLELQAHGFAPQAIIGDAGSGLQAGQALALPDVPRRSDVFHVLHELAPVVTFLVNQRAAVLAFAQQLDADLGAVAADFQVPVAVARAVLAVQQMDLRDSRRWPPEAALRQQLRGRFYELYAAVAAVARGTVRASSVVENLNSRLRNYFFLRRQLGPDYLQLLPFFLNHRRFLRSEHPERVDQSPAELLTGQAHAHWLELLGLLDPLAN